MIGRYPLCMRAFGVLHALVRIARPYRGYTGRLNNRRIKLTALPRAPAISMLWISLATVVTHWVLSLRQMEATLNGRYVRLEHLPLP